MSNGYNYAANFIEEAEKELTKTSILDMNEYLAPHDHSYGECFQNLSTACCLPCSVLGEISSMINREARPVEKKTLGKNGYFTCLYTGLFCIVGWPISPLLSAYMYRQRVNFRTIHENSNPNSVRRADTSCLSVMQERCLICCCWPCAVQEHRQYVQAKQRSGLLPFHWEYELLDKKLPLPPQATTSLVQIMGPNGSGKTTLFQKILRTSDGPLHDRIRERVPDDNLRIGSCASHISPEEIHFVEVWDIPYQDVMALRPPVSGTGTSTSLLFRAIGCNASNTVLLTYDPTDPNGMTSLSELYAQLQTILNTPGSSSGISVVLLIMKYDLICDEVEETGEMLLKQFYDIEVAEGHGKEAGVPEIELALKFKFADPSHSNMKNQHLGGYYSALMWAHEHQIDVIKVSTLSNTGVNSIISKIHSHYKKCLLLGQENSS